MKTDFAMVIVESCGYRFDFGSKGTAVVFNGVPLGGVDVTPNDEKMVKECLQDMGKWEAVVKALSDLVGEAGLSKGVSKIKTFRPDAYKIETQPEEGAVRGAVSLTKEERWRRGTESALSVEEVAQQLVNVDKWRNLQRAISSLRSLQ